MINELSVLAAFVAKLQYEELPERVIKEAKLRILDSLSVIIGASSSEAQQKFLQTYQPYGGIGKSEIMGSSLHTDLRTAVFLNAIEGHVLELDDVHTNSKTHCGTVVVPAAWCLAQEKGSSGKELILAVVCGYEVMTRIGKAFGVTSHRGKGWHATATAGTFGAAAACGKMLGLDEKQMLHALGMAGTQSFGRWAFLGDGANCKVLHPGRAAENGLDAALLAETGMSGPAHILTADDGGLLCAMSDSFDVKEVSKNLGEVWEICAVDVKPYASCRSTHPAIDAALFLKQHYHLQPENIAQILVETYQIAYMQCGEAEWCRNPVSVSQAKFSIPFVVACALLFGEVKVDYFNETYLAIPDVHALMRKVEVQPAQIFTDRYPTHWGCNVRIVDGSGNVYEKEIMDAVGSVYNPINEEKMIVKAKDLMRPAFGENTDTCIGKLAALEEIQALGSLEKR